MTSLLCSLNSTKHRGLSINTMPATGDTHKEYANGQLYFTQGTSLAEDNIARYNDGNGNRNPINNDSKLDTRTHPDTGLQHPYDTVRNFLSQLPLYFQG